MFKSILTDQSSCPTFLLSHAVVFSVSLPFQCTVVSCSSDLKDLEKDRGHGPVVVREAEDVSDRQQILADMDGLGWKPNSIVIIVTVIPEAPA